MYDHRALPDSGHTPAFNELWWFVIAYIYYPDIYLNKIRCRQEYGTAIILIEPRKRKGAKIYSVEEKVPES